MIRLNIKYPNERPMNQAEQDFLVLSAQNGCHSSFKVLYLQFQVPMTQFAIKSCREPELAKDAVQETWIKTAKGLRKLNDPRAFKSWIYRLLRWTLTDLLRKRTKELSRYESYDEQEKSVEPIEELGSDTKDESLTLAIERLPTIEREMIHLFYLEEMSVNEISITLEIPQGTIKSRLNRARKMLKQKYQSLESDYEHR